MHQVEYDSLYVGDLHGDIYAFEKAVEKFEQLGLEKLVLMGDYVDHWERLDVEIVHLLNTIIQYKTNNPSKVILLIGNHDLQYWYTDTIYRCSGFRLSIAQSLQRMFQINAKLFQISFKNGDFIATHAGITKAWFNKYHRLIEHWGSTSGIYDLEGLTKDVDLVLNHIWYTKDRYVLAEVPEVRQGNAGGIGGPIWADMSELMKYELIDNVNQIVGHNRVERITAVTKKKGQVIVFTDCLSKEVEFLTLKKG